MIIKVSISSNFKKPVVHLGPPPSEKVYDVFKDISFSSPLSNAGTITNYKTMYLKSDGQIYTDEVTDNLRITLVSQLFNERGN